MEIKSIEDLYNQYCQNEKVKEFINKSIVLEIQRLYGFDDLESEKEDPIAILFICLLAEAKKSKNLKN